MQYGVCIMGLMLVALPTVGCLPPSATDPAAEQQPVAAAGNQNNLYVAVMGPVRGEPAFRYWQRDAQGAWREGGVGQGVPVAVTAWRERLMVFFGTGRYGLFGLAKPVVQPSPVPAWTPAAVCEDGLGVDAFGWDAAGNPIYCRYQNGAWASERMDVALERARVRDPCAARFGGRPFLIWREEVPTLSGPRPGSRLRFVYREAGGWNGPIRSRLRVASPPLVAATDEAMLCLFRKPAPGAEPGPWTLAGYATADEDWHEVAPLTGPVPPGPLALARAGAGFYVVALSGGRPQVAPLNVESARAEDFTPISGTAKRAEGWREGLDDVLFALAIMVMVLILVNWQVRAARAREAAAGHAQAPDWTHATLLRRAGAVIVDYLLFAVLLVPVIGHFFPDFLERVLRRERLPVTDLLVLHAVWFGISVTYFSLAEATSGRTLGKALLRLEVRSETGDPITFRQALLRNVLRVVDEMPGLYLVGLISILIGPRPQRVGDRLARTVVVMRKSRPPAAA